MELLWLEYLHPDPAISRMMMMESSRYSNFLRIFSEKYDVNVRKSYLQDIKMNSVTSFLLFTIRIILRGSSNSFRSIDVLYTCPGRMALIGFLLKFFHKKIWIAAWTDAAEGELVADWLKKERPFQYKILRLIENTVLRFADLIEADPMVINQLMKKNFSNTKLISISDGSNVSMFKIPINEEFRKRHELHNNFVILYDGKLLNSYCVDDLIRSICAVIKEIPNAKLVIVGAGPELNNLKDLVNFLELEEFVLLTGLQPYQDMPYWVSLADICVLPFPNEGLQLWEWCAAGKSIIALDCENLKIHGFKHLINIFYVNSKNDFGKTIIYLFKNPQIRSRIALGATEHGLKHDWNYLAARLYEKVFKIYKSQYLERTVPSSDIE